MAAAKKDAPPEPTVYVATESGSAQVEGYDAPITFVKGQTRVRADHPILKQLPGFFEPADQHLAYEEVAAELAPAPVK